MKSVNLYWHFDTINVVLVSCLIFFYAFLLNFRWSRQCGYFIAGMAALVIAMFSPLHYLGMHYLFTAHMISHLLLLLVAPPLLVAGIPASNRLENLLRGLSRKLIRLPVVSWLAGAGIMWLWHIPIIFHRLFSMNDMMHGEHTMNMLVYLHMFSLLIAGIVFFWPIINPYTDSRLHPLAGVLYLSLACVFCSLLGLLITFAPPGLYTAYTMKSANSWWYMNAVTDQQVAGLIMWVPCCFIYLMAAVLLLHKWFSEKETNVLTVTNNTITQ